MTEWLSPQQVADTTPFSLVKVKRDLRSGVLHGHQRCRGGKWSIHPSARDAWIQDRDGVTACGCRSLRSVRKSA